MSTRQPRRRLQGVAIGLRPEPGGRGAGSLGAGRAATLLPGRPSAGRSSKDPAPPADPSRQTLTVCCPDW
jgi:hypothetical protein